MSSLRSLNSSSDRWAYSSGDLILVTFSTSSICSRKCFLVALLECSSKQNGARLIFSSLDCTTDNAAIFSATNKTRLPWYSALAIMLVMVCDLPVPGGPCKIKLLPRPDSTMASICDESTSRGMAKSIGALSLSMFLASTAWSAIDCLSCLSMSEATTTFSFSLSALEWMSFHMTNLLNENRPSIDSSMTSHFFCSMIARRK